MVNEHIIIKYLPQNVFGLYVNSVLKFGVSIDFTLFMMWLAHSITTE